jgi:hypothetical protein
MKSTYIKNHHDSHICVQEFGDESLLLEVTTNGFTDASVSLYEPEARRLARALSPLYVVKSEVGCYLTFGACVPYDGGSEDYEHRSVWTDERCQAAHFVTKEAARDAAKKACFESAGPRVVRVKR